MNGKAFTILNTRQFVGNSSDYGDQNIQKSVLLKDIDVQPPIEGEENQFTKRKTESYVFNGFGNSVSCDLPHADFGRLLDKPVGKAKFNK